MLKIGRRAQLVVTKGVLGFILFLEFPPFLLLGRGGDDISVYIAYRDGEAGRRISSWNLFELKKRMRRKRNSAWTVVRIDGKWRLADICAAIEDPLKVPVDEMAEYVVSPKGRVRKLKPPQKEARGA